MRIFTVILLYGLFSFAGSAQDVIITKDKNQFSAKIIEQTGKATRYRMADYVDGPVLYIKNSRIREIRYGNGYIDMMGYQNPRKFRPLGLSTGFAAALAGGGGMMTATADYFLIPQIDLEMNFGLSDLSGDYYFAGGSRIHINQSHSVKKLTPFTGLLAGYYYGDGFIQIPGGINYLTGAGISLSLSINQMITFNSWQATFLEFRVGWRFRL